MLNRKSNAAIAPVVAIVGALLAISVLFISSHDSIFAQEGPIEYAEKGDTPVRTFTSTDPEGDGIDDILWGRDRH